MNWAEVVLWQPGPLREYATACERAQHSLRAQAEELVAALNSLTGTGRTVTAAQNALRKEIASIEKQVNFLISSAEIASMAVQEITDIRADVEDIQQTAFNFGAHIDPSGAVSFVRSLLLEVLEFAQDPGGYMKTRGEILGRKIGEVIAKATELKVMLGLRIAQLLTDTYDNGVNYSATAPVRPKFPPASASEQEVAAWWSSLSPSDKDWMIQTYPTEIGNLDGVDFTSRNKANRIMLDRKIAETSEEYNMYLESLPGEPSEGQLKHLQHLYNRMMACKNVKTALDREFTDSDHTPRYLLAFDTSGPNVLAALSQNNPDTTDHVGVIVPGMTTNVKDSVLDYDTKSRTMREEAERQVNAGETVAMVEFLNYEAPQDVASVITADMARTGARRLAGFLNGLDASREHGAGDAHVAVAAHSFGSTTAGIAATLVGEGVIDDLTQFGSPGSGVQDVSELHVPRGHAWVSAAPYVNDLVQGVGPDHDFGKNPALMPGYRHLSGDVGPIKMMTTQGPNGPITHPDPIGLHSAYFEKNTPANIAIASVIAGKPKV